MARWLFSRSEWHVALCRNSPVLLTGALMILSAPLPAGLPSKDDVVAAVAARNSDEQGVTGRPQQNGNIHGASKSASSIDGSQFRGKR